MEKSSLPPSEDNQIIIIEEPEIENVGAFETIGSIEDERDPDSYGPLIEGEANPQEVNVTEGDVDLREDCAAEGEINPHRIFPVRRELDGVHENYFVANNAEPRAVRPAEGDNERRRRRRVENESEIDEGFPVEGDSDLCEAAGGWEKHHEILQEGGNSDNHEDSEISDPDEYISEEERMTDLLGGSEFDPFYDESSNYEPEENCDEEIESPEANDDKCDDYDEDSAAAGEKNLEIEDLISEEDDGNYADVEENVNFDECTKEQKKSSCKRKAIGEIKSRQNKKSKEETQSEEENKSKEQSREKRKKLRVRKKPKDKTKSNEKQEPNTQLKNEDQVGKGEEIKQQVEKDESNVNQVDKTRREGPSRQGPSRQEPRRQESSRQGPSRQNQIEKNKVDKNQIEKNKVDKNQIEKRQANKNQVDRDKADKNQMNEDQVSSNNSDKDQTNFDNV